MKLMILDGNENALLLSGLLSPYYTIAKETDDQKFAGRVKAEKPEILLIASDFSDFGWESAVQTLEREIPGFSETVLIVLSASHSSETMKAAGRHGAEVIVRPFEPLEFLARLAAASQRALPAKERPDGVTGLHKKAFTQDQIKQEIGKTPGLMFLVEVAKYSFAACRLEDRIVKLCAEAIGSITEPAGGTLGIAAGGRFIGFMPGITDHEDGLLWGNALADRIRSAVPDKLYISIGLADSDGDPSKYPDLYQQCDRALGLSRGRADGSASYY